MLNKEKGNQGTDDSTITQLGQTVWESVFEENNPELPSTIFMRKVKQTLTENEYQQLTKEILSALQDKKDQLC